MINGKQMAAEYFTGRHMNGRDKDFFTLDSIRGVEVISKVNSKSNISL